jgi:predicted transcriptional regulator
MSERVDDEGRPLPVFPGFAEAALSRRRLLRELAERRTKLGLSQTVVAARMGTSQSVVARLESGEVDARLSTIERYATALGQRVEWTISEE